MDVGEGMRLAYLDPGSGSFIIQALLASLAGLALVVNRYWLRLKKLFGRGKPENEEEKPSNADE